MKKLLNIFTALVLSFSVFALAGCADAMVDDGDNIRKYGVAGGSAGGAVPFSMYNDMMDLQVWEGTFTSITTDEEMICTVGSVGWWGGIWCIDAAANDDSAKKKFDFTEVSKIKITAKASADGDIWVSACADTTQHTVSITTDYVEYEIDVSEDYDKSTPQANNKPAIVPGRQHYGLVAFGGNNPEGTLVYIKNITYLDKSGKEVIPVLK